MIYKLIIKVEEKQNSQFLVVMETVAMSATVTMQHEQTVKMLALLNRTLSM